MCAPDGILNENHLKLSFSKIIADRPRDFRQILHELHRLVKMDVEGRIVIIESAAELDSLQCHRIESNLAEEYGEGLTYQYSIVPALLGGVKIRVADDVWDGSVQAKLAKLTNSF